MINFRKANVKGEDFDRDIPAEISKGWGTIQDCIATKVKEDF